VQAVNVPVTLKTRTGWDREHRNGVRIARIAEDCGIQMLAMHGRTRADKYTGDAEYETIAAVKQAVHIPVLANGDIDSPEKAEMVLVATGCDGIMTGRGAHGRPWIFRDTKHFLLTREILPPPSAIEVAEIILGHMEALYAFYGEFQGLRFARKHVGWYMAYLPGGADMTRSFNKLESSAQQLAFARDYFGRLANGEVRAA